jgi:hypothetical protein
MCNRCFSVRHDRTLTEPPRRVKLGVLDELAESDNYTGAIHGIFVTVAHPPGPHRDDPAAVDRDWPGPGPFVTITAAHPPQRRTPAAGVDCKFNIWL